MAKGLSCAEQTRLCGRDGDAAGHGELGHGGIVLPVLLDHGTERFGKLPDGVIEIALIVAPDDLVFEAGR